MKYTIMKYLRISSEDIDLDGLDKYESNSVANQRALLDDFIYKTSEFDGCDIIEAVDDGRSGTNFQRPGIQQVLDLAQRGIIQCIIVKDLSRFGRNFLEVGDYLEQIFPTWGVRFISVTDMYDSAQYSGATGGINIAFRNLIAEMYSQDLAEKVRSARDGVNKNGKSTAPYGFYGYIRDPNDRHKLIIDEPAAEIVRLIYELREQGMTTPKIARKLNQDGVQTASERKKQQGSKRDWLRNSTERMWETSFITRILRDERYTGRHIYGKMRRVELGKAVVKAVPESEWIIVPDVFPAIITTEQFERVQESMGKKSASNSSRAKNSILLFSHKIFCGACGKALVRRKSAHGYVYGCSTPSIKAGLGCMRGNIRESEVAETVLNVIQQQAQFADKVKSLGRSNEKSSFENIESISIEIQSLQRLIEKANSTKLSLWEKQLNADMSKEAYHKDSEKLTDQIAIYTDKIAELKRIMRTMEMKSGQEDVFVERFSKQIGIQELSQGVVDEFINKIRVYAHDRIEVTLNYVDAYYQTQMQKES